MNWRKVGMIEKAIAPQERNINGRSAAERVYPQHLIGVAISHLEAAGVDWSEVRNVEELREQLNL